MVVRNHLALRDLLRRDQGLREKYGRVKVELVEREWEDVWGGGGGEYGSKKSEVLGRILEKAGFDGEERRQILGVTE